MMGVSSDPNDANQTLFAHISADPQDLVDSAFNVQKLVEQGASISEVASDAPLVLGARAFARAHLDKVPSPARTRTSFSLTRKANRADSPFEQLPQITTETSACDETALDDAPADLEHPRISPSAECYFIGEDANHDEQGPGSNLRKFGRRQRKPSIGAKRSNMGHRCRSRQHRSKSRRRNEGGKMEAATSAREELEHLASRAQELEEAKKRLAQLEDGINTKQSLNFEERIRELEESRKNLNELAETRETVQNLDRVVAEQSSQIMLLLGEISRLEQGMRNHSDEEVIEHDLDLIALQNVCRALYSERTARELDCFSDKSSQALVADLARRFPFASGIRQSPAEDSFQVVQEDICFESVD